MVLVGGVDIVGQAHYRVLEGEQRPWVDVELDVQVDRATAAVLGVQVDLPRLAQRVGLDEVALVVDVETVVTAWSLRSATKPATSMTAIALRLVVAWNSVDSCATPSSIR